MKRLTQIFLAAAFTSLQSDAPPNFQAPPQDPEQLAHSFGDHDAIVRLLTQNPLSLTPIAESAMTIDHTHVLTRSADEVTVIDVLNNPALAGIGYEDGYAAKIIPRDALQDLQNLIDHASKKYNLGSLNIIVTGENTFSASLGNPYRNEDGKITRDIYVSKYSFETLDAKTLKNILWHEIGHCVKKSTPFDKNYAHQKYEVSADSIMYENVGKDEALRTLKAMYEIHTNAGKDYDHLMALAEDSRMSPDLVLKLLKLHAETELTFKQLQDADHPPTALRILMIDLLDQAKKDPAGKTADYLTLKKAFKYGPQ